MPCWTEPMPPLPAIIRQLLHLVLPVACTACGTALSDDPVPFFCRTCWSSITPLSGPMCSRCGRPFPSTVALQYSPRHLCGACRKRRPAYTRAWSLYAYAPPLQDAIRLFKYHGKVILSAALGDLMCTALRSAQEADI